MDDSFQDGTNEEEDFTTVPLDDDVWLGEPVPDRYFWIHEESHLHDQCLYPCPYSLDQLHSAPEDAPTPYFEMMDLSDISDVQDVMTTTIDEDIPDVDDASGLLIWTMVYINIYTPWLSIWTKMELYNEHTNHSVFNMPS